MNSPLVKQKLNIGDKIKIADFKELWLVTLIEHTVYRAYDPVCTVDFEGPLEEIEEIHKKGAEVIYTKDLKDAAVAANNTEIDWEEEQVNIYAMIQSFASRGDLANYYKVSSKRIDTVLKNLGITAKPYGKYIQEIADKVGCSYTTAVKHIRGTGLSKEFGAAIDQYTTN